MLRSLFLLVAGAALPRWAESVRSQARAANSLGQARLRTDVYVMMPLTTIATDGSRLSDPAELGWLLDKAKGAGVDGIMVDMWWGLTEVQPRTFNFAGYRQLFDLARQKQLKVQAVASFHQCGGNVGDECDIRLPSFVLSAQDVWYKDAQGHENREYISLFADHVPIAGRTPMQMYGDWLAAFAKEFSADMGTLITEVMVGMGPAGELRYPAYPLAYWTYCGVGQFQAFDKYALANFREAVANASANSGWTMPPSSTDAGQYGSRPQDTLFFTDGYRSDYGKFFLDWYSGALKAHGDRLLGLAASTFRGAVPVVGKIAGIHWWYGSVSHAAELTAGYYNTNSRNTYREFAAVFAKHGATLDFTCLEMRTSEQQPECLSNPEGLVGQVVQAAADQSVPFGGENALARYDQAAYDQIVSYKSHLHTFTYLRLSRALVSDEHLGGFAGLVRRLQA